MGKTFKQYWFNIKSSLWFLPALMALLSAAIALLLVSFDRQADYSDLGIDWLVYKGHIEGARVVLTTIAASMITMAAVTFSITLVALTMASAQFGPRMLRNFISDRGNQFVIGTFISAFVYPLIVLLYSRELEEEDFIPQLSVIFAFFLALLSLAVVIYFLHQVSTSIQADYIVRSSYNEFIKAKHTLFTEGKAPPQSAKLQEARAMVAQTHKDWTELSLDKSGYIQSVDYSLSAKLAEREDLVVEWLVFPGKFAHPYQPFVRILHNGEVPEEASIQLKRMVMVGYQRTPNQDPIFSITQIAEVGIRALSPGINDPHTAVICIKWLGAALSEVARCRLDSDVLSDPAGKIRVIMARVSYREIVDTCFDELLLYGRQNVHVTGELLKVIRMSLGFAPEKELLQLLVQKATAIFECARANAAHQSTSHLEEIYEEIGRCKRDDTADS